ncbi:MAG TPA: hypothetical protein VFB27_04095 [Opitutaceae bacterium]|nr:hypothetical protein [Opitutaceae bacterium]
MAAGGTGNTKDGMGEHFCAFVPSVANPSEEQWPQEAPETQNENSL